MVGITKERVPWWLKIGAKLVLSRLHVTYSKWRSIGIFQHGFMLDPGYALSVFRKHYDQAKTYLPPSYSVLELGPGDSLATAVMAASYGADKVFLVDVGPFASMSIEPYRALLKALSGQEAARNIPENCHSVADMLAATNAVYLTGGLQSLRALPDASVDFVFSQAVLEHIASGEFIETIRELHRLQKPGGVASHRIDLQDHLAHSLNSLRFSSSLWESRFFAGSGFYTNRLRAGQIVDIFTSSGYNVLARQDDKWPALPIQRRKLHRDYASLAENELLIRGLDLFVQKPH